VTTMTAPCDSASRQQQHKKIRHSNFVELDRFCISTF
jgi:hypothetical protein